MKQLARGFSSIIVILAIVILIGAGALILTHSSSSKTYDGPDLSFQYPSSWKDITGALGQTTEAGTVVFLELPSQSLDFEIKKQPDSIVVPGTDEFQYDKESEQAQTSVGPITSITFGGEEGFEGAVNKAGVTESGHIIPPTRQHDVYVLHNGYVYQFTYFDDQNDSHASQFSSALQSVVFKK